MNKHDIVFLKHFTQIIVALMAVTFFLIIGAIYIYADHAPEPSTVKQAQTDARIAPLGGVYTGDTGRAALLAAQEAANKAAAAQVAYEGTLDGSVIYGKLCGACHVSGAGGAPLMTKTIWAPRVAQGLDKLVEHAIAGFQGDAGIMPPRGGNPSLNDEQIKATVEWMIDSLK